MTVLVVMGVSGAGKTTIGLALARRLEYEFIEGDEFHSRANREKMHAGIALTDEDREPWLEALRSRIAALMARHGNAIVTCSALKRAHREILRRKGLQFIYLKAGAAVLRARLVRRRGHFFSPALLESQLATLEEPRDAIVVDAEKPDLEVVDQVLRELAAETPGLSLPERRPSESSSAPGRDERLAQLKS